MRSLLILALAAICAMARADDLRPLYVELQLDAAPMYRIAWRLPPNLLREVAPELELPADCDRPAPARGWSDGTGHWREAAWRCGAPLAGRGIVVRYPRGNPGLPTILKLTDAGAAPRTVVFGPDVTTLPVPAAAASATGTIPGDYFVLGLEHIAFGFDHLLFVACLVWIAGTPRRILATVTGFTLAHSVTLVLAALGLVAVPIRTIEVLIALSIVLLAVELARNDRTTITWRHPIAVSTSFGLLHGFGFAAVLGEIGLPREGLVGALLAFNVGIELGQLLFVLAVAAAARMVAGAGATLQAASLRWGVAYSSGLIATWWMLERAAPVLP